MRYGGLFSRYYKWREGIGPPEKRPWMRNYVWGGKETNRVGTHEFVDFCRQVGAEPLYCVNFLSDGEKRYDPAHPDRGLPSTTSVPRFIGLQSHTGRSMFRNVRIKAL
jgi:alpha-L-arabinofuranosidase